MKPNSKATPPPKRNISINTTKNNITKFYNCLTINTKSITIRKNKNCWRILSKIISIRKKTYYSNSTPHKASFSEIPIKNYRPSNLNKTHLITNHLSKDINKKVLHYNIHLSPKRNNNKHHKLASIKMSKSKSSNVSSSPPKKASTSPLFPSNSNNPNKNNPPNFPKIPFHPNTSQNKYQCLPFPLHHHQNTPQISTE